MPHVCPWWFVYAFDNPLRGLVHDPQRIFGPYVRPGARALDLGCGRGFATLGLARLVGAEGKVVAVDVQQRMLRMVERRLERTGLGARVALRLASENGLGLGADELFDLVNAFWMVHEVGDQSRLYSEVRDHLAPGGRLLVCEPRLHVTGREFAASLHVASDAGLEVSEWPRVALSHAALLRPGPT